jgi:hypothetical protein
VDPGALTPSAPAAGMAGPRRWNWKRTRYLLDSRSFHLLTSGQPSALEGFRASLARHRLPPEGGLPPLEMTPLAFLEAIGIDPPHYEGFPLPAGWARYEETYLVTSAIAQMAKDFFAKAPELQADHLRKRVEELRQKTDPAAQELFDLCLTRFVSRDKFEEEILGHLAFDFVYKSRYPEEMREEVFEFLAASLFGAAAENVSGLSKMRIVKTLWDRSYERLLKNNPGSKREIQALDREMRFRTYKDFLAWELVHHSILGFGVRTQVFPVVAFVPEPEETLKARCSAYKSALRDFLDGISREELETELRPRLKAWKPGLLVPIREDGTLDTLISTAELPVYR